MLNPDDILSWPDGSWMFVGEFCWEVDRWKGDDYDILPEGSKQWCDVLTQDGGTG